MLKKCKKCNLPETNETIVFEGQSCNLCNSTEDYKTKINWGERKLEFESYRTCNLLTFYCGS